MVDAYPLLKLTHVFTAVTTAGLMILRLGLDAIHRPWRHTWLRWLPHLNDTVLLLSALALVVVTGWVPFRDSWLTAKVLLLCFYIIAGKLALDPQRKRFTRQSAAACALVILAGIFWVARHRALPLL